MCSSAAAALVNRKWLLCVQAILVGFVLFLGQSWRPGSSAAALERQAESGESHVQLPLLHTSQSPVVAERASPPPKIVTPPPPPSVIDIVSVEYSNSSDASVSGGGGDGAAAEGKCDIFEGKWVYEEAYPLYKARRCPILSGQVSCRKNKRPDSGYEHLKWEANGCAIPRFNGTDMLERLRGKRVVIVGDSLNRNQWESLACLLYTSTNWKRSYFKLTEAYKIFKSLDYDCTVEFYWSPFLVPLEGDDGKPKVLKLEKLPKSANRWKGANVMVFNTGHWWTHQGHLKKWTYLEHKGEWVEEMEGYTAFETAMKTWADWIDRSVDSSKTMVFFRSISPEHKKESNHWCYNQTSPMTDDTYKQWFPSMMRSIVERTIADMKTPVKYLNITRLSEFRRDAHTAIYTTRAGKLLTPEQQRQPKSYADCSHWCLPGLPDTWNVLIYSFIIESPSIFL